MANGRLTERQLEYSRLVAGGMPEEDAYFKAGYSQTNKSKLLKDLRNNKRVCEQIKYYKNTERNEVVADKLQREKFWTEIMFDPSWPASVRLEASKLLGKAQGDFVVKKQIEIDDNKKPVVAIPKSSPAEWEEYWEKNNE